MPQRSEDPPEFSAGDAYRYRGPGQDQHPWVIVSDPLLDIERVLVANFTKWFSWKDQTCIVEASECPNILTLKSCLRLDACRIHRLGTLEEQLDRSHIVIKGNVGSDVLQRIRLAIQESPLAPFEAKAILDEQSLV